MDGTLGVRHLVVVERSEVSRLGRAAVARRALGAGWEVTTADPDSDLRGVKADLVVAVVAPDGRGFDRYDVVDRIGQLVHGTRADAQGAVPVGATVVAATVHPNPLLDIRLVAAGVHRVVSVDAVSRSDGGHFAAVVEAAVGSARGGGGDEERQDPVRWAGTDPGAVLAYVAAHGIQEAFAPGSSQVESGLSRRGIMRVRRDLAELGGIRPSLHRYTGGADRRIDLPTWREVVTYVNCARGEVDWGDDAWGDGPGPRIGQSRHGVEDLVWVARELIA